MTRNTRAGAEAGFTLLEVLIAFLIAAGALTMLFRATVEGQSNATVAAQYQEALSRARSRLAAVEATGAIVAGDQQGDDGGGFRWRVRTTPVLTGAPSAGPAPVLLAVSVAVSWTLAGRERTVQLDTQRLGAAPAPPP